MTPAADQSRRSLVRRRESWIAAARRRHGTAIEDNAIGFTVCIAVNVTVWLPAMPPQWWAWPLRMIAATLSGVLAGALAVGVKNRAVRVIRWAAEINASRRYLDDEDRS